MLTKILLPFLFGICLASVVELNDDNFESLTKDKTWLVAFTATWCGKPCEELHPVLEEFSNLYSGTLQVGNVTHKQDLVQRFDIQFYPAIILVGKGKYFHFVGTRNVTELTKFVSGDYRLSIPYDVPPKKEVELIHSLTSANFDKKVMNPRGAYWVVLFCDREDKNCFSIQPAWKGVARMEKGKFNFGEVDKQSSSDLFERFSIGSKITSLYVFRAGNRHEYEGAYNFEDMQGFAEGGWNKSRPIKVQTKEEIQEQLGDVKVLTDGNFDAITKAMSISSSTPWFVEFYAPWCGHCKSIAPVWEQVATELRHRVNVAKLDCVANKNSSERFSIPGFPTLLLFKGGKFWQYDGSLRTKEAFVEWALKGYSEGKNKEGWAVPPPIGQPVPPPTWEDLIYTAKDDFTNFVTYSPLPTFTLFGGGAFIGFCVSSYLLLLYSIIKLFGGNNSQPQKANKKEQKKKK